jgi:hypothetical protein
MDDQRKQIIQDIFNHKYYVHGKCLGCGKDFEKLTNSVGIHSSCCSDACANKIIAEKKNRNKERHHYEVYRDDGFYYIKIDGIFEIKRNYNGRTWQLKSVSDKENANRPDHYKSHYSVLSNKTTIPTKSVKIIDQISAYLYDDKNPFREWKNKGGL